MKVKVGGVKVMAVSGFHTNDFPCGHPSMSSEYHHDHICALEQMQGCRGKGGLKIRVRQVRIWAEKLTRQAGSEGLS